LAGNAGQLRSKLFLSQAALFRAQGTIKVAVEPGENSERRALQEEMKAGAASLGFLGETVMPDQEITCAECGTTFTFTEREQEYYNERNLSQPKRCKACRDARRANFGSSPRGGGGDRQRYEITCDQCGKTDTVPFKPSSGRAVLCSECFSASRA
jgi:CxxC-x17-CxxC domain-containing protein